MLKWDHVLYFSCLLVSSTLTMGRKKTLLHFLPCLVQGENFHSRPLRLKEEFEPLFPKSWIRAPVNSLSAELESSLSSVSAIKLCQNWYTMRKLFGFDNALKMPQFRLLVIFLVAFAYLSFVVSGCVSTVCVCLGKEKEYAGNYGLLKASIGHSFEKLSCKAKYVC